MKLGRSLAFLYAALVMLACVRYVPVEHVVVRPQPACLLNPPPALPAVVLQGPDAGCPGQYIGCLDIDNALMLEQRERTLQRYAKEAWLRCGNRLPRDSIDGG